MRILFTALLLLSFTASAQTVTTSVLSPYGNVKFDTARLKKTDTTAMLLPYLRKVDTTVMLTPYLHEVDTTAMLSPYLHEVDTTAMLTPYARKAGPTFTGTVTIPTPFTLGATSVTSTGTQLNYLSSATGTTGTATTNVVFSTSPTLITPVLGVASATSINTGTTLNGKLFGKSTTDISLSSTAHAATFGDESTGQNLAIGTYSTGTGIQSRNNGANGAFFICPIGGSDVHVGGTFAGKQSLYLNNTSNGTTSYAALEVRNANSANDALRLYCMGTGWTTSGMNKQDYGVVATGTSISGLSIGTQASAPIEVYTNNTLRTTWAASTGDISTTGQVVSTGGGLGYATGAGGTVTQGTSRSTGVTLNKLCGTITMFSAAQAADATVTFTLTNSFIASTDFILVQHISATNGGAWEFSVVAGSGSCTITVRNTSGGSITEATPLRFTIIKAVNN